MYTLDIELNINLNIILYLWIRIIRQAHIISIWMTMFVEYYVDGFSLVDVKCCLAFF